MVYAPLTRWFDFLFPGACVLCGATVAATQDFCGGCERDLPSAAGACAGCAAPLAAAGSGQRCGRCQQAPPAFDGAVAAFPYAAPIDRLILRLKYHGDLTVARVLGARLAARLAQRAEPAPQLLVPVPLHPARLRERGYNQALEIARPIAQTLGIAIDYRGTERVRATAPQIDMDYAARRNNLRGAFRTLRDYSGARLAIVDDVMTSGHTVNALARELRRAGAREVRAWIVARA